MRTDIEKARTMYKILTDGQDITEESREYAGYGDETSARVASYNYTTVEKVVGFKHKFSLALRGRASFGLKKLLNESEELKEALSSGDREVKKYQDFLKKETREAITGLVGCLAIAATLGGIVGYLTYEFLK